MSDKINKINQSSWYRLGRDAKTKTLKRMTSGRKPFGQEGCFMGWPPQRTPRTGGMFGTARSHWLSTRATLAIGSPEQTAGMSFRRCQ